MSLLVCFMPHLDLFQDVSLVSFKSEANDIPTDHCVVIFKNSIDHNLLVQEDLNIQKVV